MRIIGFDVSTTTIGYSVLDYDKDKKTVSLKHVNYLKPSKKGSIFQKLSDVKCDIIDILEKYNPDEVVIENIIEFIQQKSSSKTIIALAIINRVVGLTVLEHTGKEPNLMNVNSVRSVLRPEDHDGRLQKEQIPDVLEKHYKLKFEHKLKRNDKIAPETYDMADSIAVGLGWLKKNFPVEIV